MCVYVLIWGFHCSFGCSEATLIAVIATIPSHYYIIALSCYYSSNAVYNSVSATFLSLFLPPPQ